MCNTNKLSWFEGGAKGFASKLVTTLSISNFGSNIDSRVRAGIDNGRFEGRFNHFAENNIENVIYIEDRFSCYTPKTVMRGIFEFSELNSTLFASCFRHI